MDFIIGILVGILWIGGILFMRSITTFFHEMGHALPALLFTKNEKVNVLVGSYGNIENSLGLQLGRLALYLKFNIFNWRIGLCSHGPIKGFIPQLIVILGGPLASLTIALAAFYFIKSNELSQPWIIFISFFLISAIIDFLVNIDPSHKPIKLWDNSVTYSDGYQLMRTFKRRGLPNSFFEAENLLKAKKPNETIEKCMSLIESGVNKKVVYDLMIEACLVKKDYKTALDIYQSIKAIHPYTYLDFYQIGLLNLQINRLDEALPYFDHCIFEKHDDGLALAKRGYIHLQKGNWQRAQQDLEASISYTPNNPEAWNNRGLFHLKNGNLSASAKDLQIAFQIAPNDPNVLYHLGLYHEADRKLKEALHYFQQAKANGLTYHGIDLKIAEVEALVEAFL